MLRMLLGNKRRLLLCEKVADADDFDSDAEKEDPEHFMSKDTSESTKLEPWVDWIKRTTHDVEEKCKQLNMTSWVEKVRGLKWNLAERVITQDCSRWSRQALAWDPEHHFSGLQPKAQRRQARPKLRWMDDITEFLKIKNLPSLRQMQPKKDFFIQHQKEFVSGAWRNRR